MNKFLQDGTFVDCGASKDLQATSRAKRSKLRADGTRQQTCAHNTHVSNVACRWHAGWWLVTLSGGGRHMEREGVVGIRGNVVDDTVQGPRAAWVSAPLRPL